ncbi:hypothetical protein HMI55_002055 [Coelomomyces lativittatus]|nr:hypothetical protein HMI56_003403 [Coelomomyces lativittatus]KAJ1518170.1 hypothetical protein HMI55_002055 [Coelomomyces lativittatus]
MMLHPEHPSLFLPSHLKKEIEPGQVMVPCLLLRLNSLCAKSIPHWITWRMYLVPEFYPTLTSLFHYFLEGGWSSLHRSFFSYLWSSTTFFPSTDTPFLLYYMHVSSEWVNRGCLPRECVASLLPSTSVSDSTTVPSKVTLMYLGAVATRKHRPSSIHSFFSSAWTARLRDVILGSSASSSWRFVQHVRPLLTWLCTTSTLAPAMQVSIIYSLPLLMHTDLEGVFQIPELASFILSFLLEHPMGFNLNEPTMEDPFFKLLGPLFYVYSESFKTCLGLPSVPCALLDRALHFFSEHFPSRTSWNRVRTSRLVSFHVYWIHQWTQHFSLPFPWSWFSRIVPLLGYVYELTPMFPTFLEVTNRLKEESQHFPFTSVISLLTPLRHYKYVLVTHHAWISHFSYDALVLWMSSVNEVSEAYITFCMEVFHHVLGVPELWTFYVAFLIQQRAWIGYLKAWTWLPSSLSSVDGFIHLIQSTFPPMEQVNYLCVIWAYVPSPLSESVGEMCLQICKQHPEAMKEIQSIWELVLVHWERREWMVRSWNAWVNTVNRK